MVELRKKLEYAFKLRCDWGIGADVIVGFPGESKDILKKRESFWTVPPISYLHVFPYSLRPELRR